MYKRQELAYWYLRLNGFFPISNFVVHKSEGVEHRSDVDVLAIRMPHVFEPVGGQTDDWDSYLCEHLDFALPLAISCEVKTGRFLADTIFRREQLACAISRTGMVRQDHLSQTLDRLTGNAYAEAPSMCVVAKLLVSREETTGPFLNRTLRQVREFLEQRVKRYDYEKYASRMFFPSALLQNLIDHTHHELGDRAA